MKNLICTSTILLAALSASTAMAQAPTSTLPQTQPDPVAAGESPSAVTRSCKSLTPVGGASVDENSFGGGFEPKSRFEWSMDPSRESAPQIQQHLRCVIVELEARDVSTLTDGQRTQRAAHVHRLGKYAAAGQFPQNIIKSIPTPVFIDDGGRACAVGHLMLTSGAGELARHIARTQNTAYVSEIHADGLADWLNDSGLSAEECAWIQPTYWPCGYGGPIPNYTSSCLATVPNSYGAFGTMLACGSTVVSNNDLSLHVMLLPIGTTAYFIASRSVGSSPLAGGSQGSLCLAGAIGRYSASRFVTWWSFPGGVGGHAVDLGQTPTPTGATMIAPGETWHFQCWYRDNNPGPTSNFSDVLSITFS